MNSTSLSLDWDLPVLIDRNGPITGYMVNLTVLEDHSVLLHFASASEIDVANLHPYYTYSCMVQARTSAGVGPYSSPVSVRTLQDG